MAEELTARVMLQHDMQFIAVANSARPIVIDNVTSPAMAGPSPMELILAGLAGCAGMDVLSILRKKRQNVQHFEVSAHGVRSDDYPKVYTSIHLEFLVGGENIDPTAVERAIELARERYCPVWAMLRASVQITDSYTISA